MLGEMWQDIFVTLRGKRPGMIIGALSQRRCLFCWRDFCCWCLLESFGCEFDTVWNAPSSLSFQSISSSRMLVSGAFPAVGARTPVENILSSQFNWDLIMKHQFTTTVLLYAVKQREYNINPQICGRALDSEISWLLNQLLHSGMFGRLKTAFFSYSVSFGRTIFKNPVTCSKGMGSRVRVLVIVDGSALNLNHNHKPCAMNYPESFWIVTRVNATCSGTFPDGLILQ